MTMTPWHSLLPEPIILLLLGTIMLVLGNMQRRATNLAADAKETVKD